MSYTWVLRVTNGLKLLKLIIILHNKYIVLMNKNELNSFSDLPFSCIACAFFQQIRSYATLHSQLCLHFLNCR